MPTYATPINLSSCQGEVSNNIVKAVENGVLVANNCGNLLITGNEFRDIADGFETDYLSGVKFYQSPLSGPVVITNNFFDGCDYGVNTSGSPNYSAQTVDIHLNSFTNTGFKTLRNFATGTFNATCNWFGTTDPSLIAGKIFQNLPNGVVNYIPYLASGSDADVATGFQTNESCTECTIGVTSTPTDATCPSLNNGQATANVTDNAGAVTYLWSNGQTTNPATGLVAGTYSVTVTDATGCTATSANVTVSNNTTTGPVHNGANNYCTIQSAIDAASPNDEITVDAGTYNEDININKTLKITGADNATTIIQGVNGGDIATVRIAANNIELSGFTITRYGNSVDDWNDATLNSAGIAVQGISLTGMNIHDNIITGNRSAIDVNNSNGHNIHNNVINNNHTGVIFRNQTDNINFTENEVTNNRTVGVLYLDGSGGTNVPAQSALNCNFFNNNISGNWYGQIVERQSGGSIPIPGTTNLKNFSGNWFGTNAPVVTTANSAEPGYASLIPEIFGGTATPPGGQPDIAGPASPNFDYTPYLNTGTDVNIETTAGRGTFGFQGSFSNLWVTKASAQTGATGRIQEGVNMVSGSTVNVTAGTYNETVVIDENNLLLNGANAGVDPCTGSRGAETIITGTSTAGVINVDANNVTIDGVKLVPVGTGASGTYGILSQSTSTGLEVKNTLIDGASSDRDGINTQGTSSHLHHNKIINALYGIGGGSDDASFPTSAIIEDNCIDNTRLGITGYHDGSSIQRNIINNFTPAGPSAGISGQLLNTTVTQNTVTNYPNGAGIALTAYGTRPNSANTTITNNFVNNNGAALYADATATLVGVEAHYNDLSNNFYSVQNLSTASFNAACNWHGSADLATVTSKISGVVSYVPYLTIGTDADGGTAGFQTTETCSACTLGVTITPTDPTCPSLNNGQALANVTGAVGTVTYLWSNGQTTNPATGLVAGNYSVTVTDENGCTAMNNVTLSNNTTAGPVHNLNTLLNYCTIQAAIDAPQTMNGHVISIDAGTYTEDVVVTKELEIKGVGNTTIIMPGTSNPNTGGGSLPGANVFLVQANNVTIHDLVVDGDNTSLTSAVNVGGANIDARNGIITNHLAGVYSNLTVHHVTVKNIYLRGIYASSGGSFNFHHNIVSNVQADAASIAIFSFGGSGTIDNNMVSDASDAIATNHSAGTVMSNNTVTNSGTGLHSDNNGDSGGVADEISGNNISNSAANGYGIFVFAPYRNVTVHDNTVSNVDVGMASAGAYAAVTPVFSNNIIDGQNKAGSTGMYATTQVWGFTSGNNTTSFINNYVINNADGFYLETDPGYILNFNAHKNSITGYSNSSVTTTGSGTLNADMTCNWWGTTSSASIASSISGSGVTYIPYLISGTDADLVTTGFQTTEVCTTCGLGVTITPTDPTCPSLNNGEALANVTGAVGTVTYLWSNGLTTNPATGLIAGNYSVTVTDENGCTAMNNVTLSNPALPVQNVNTGLYYCTIQAAINDALTLNGHVITVAAGTYPENVILNKSLTLKGAQFGVDARGRVTGSPNPAVESVIAPATAASLELLAGSSSSTIDGFAMLGNVSRTDGVVQIADIHV